MSKPAGALNVHVIEGKEMPSMDIGGGADTYVSIKIGKNEKKSKVVMKNLTPIWNEHLQVEIPSMNDTVEIAVYDWDRFSRNDLIGKASIPLSKLQLGKNDMWFPLGQINNKFPQVHLILEIQPRMIITLIEGKDLPAMDIGGTSDPFVEFVVGKEKKKSNVVKKNLNPKWNETFDFQVTNMNDVLYVNVFDWDMLSSNDAIGQGVVSFGSLNMGKNDIWVPLPKKGSIHLEIDAQGFGKVQQQQSFQQNFNSQQSFNQQGFNQQQNFNQQGFNQQSFNQQGFNQFGQQQQQQQFNQFGQQQQFNPMSQQGFIPFNSQQGFNQQQFNQQQSFNQQGFNQQQQNFNTQQNQQQYNTQQGSFNQQQSFNTQQQNQQQSFNNQQQNQQQSFNQQQEKPSPDYKNLPVVEYFVYSDYVYGINQARAIKLSHEKGWKKNLFGTFLNGNIYTISEATGHLMEWSAITGASREVSTDDWSNARGMCLNQGYLYVVCKDVYKVDPRNGSYSQVTRDGNWDKLCYECVCPYGNELLAITKDDGKIYAINISNGKSDTISEEDWSKSKGLCNVNGTIYIVHDYIWELDVETGDATEASKEGQWDFTEHSCSHAGRILLLVKMKGGKIVLHEWNPKNGNYVALDNDDWSSASTICSPVSGSK